MDYRELLLKYIAHIVTCEGITFVDRCSDRGSGQYDVKFTAEEIAELRKLGEESEKYNPS